MTMHPELEEAFNKGLSMPKVFKLFTKHHSGPIEECIEHDYEFHEPVHMDCAFWDDWKPLFHRLKYYSKPYSGSVDEPFMSTHKALTREIISWLCDSERRSNVYFISETPRPTLYALENTRAHLFADVCYKAQRFGQPIHFNPWGGIDSLIAQLAAHYPPYRRILARKLIDTPMIIQLSTRTRFRKLIHEPWKALRESHPQYITTPPVVILGWDSESPDEELLRSIYEFSSLPHSSLLLWIISIDTNIRLPIQDLLHPFPPFRYFRLLACYKDTPADAALVLHHQFRALRRRYKEMFDEDEVWPSEEQMSQLVRVVAGVFETVQVIIQFIDWEDDGGPKAHLETFLAHTVDSPLPSDERPYCALDHFYTRALSNIPPHLLSLFKQAFSIVYYGIYTPEFLVLSLACLLRKDALLALVPHVHRLGFVRTKGWGNSWFKRFLEDPTQSGKFYAPQFESRLYIFQASLRILRHVSNPTAMLKLVAQETQINPKTSCTAIYNLRVSACDELCRFGHAASESKWTLLHRFDFRCLAHTCDKLNLVSFTKFLMRLYLESKKVNSPKIVRVQPIGLLDREYIDKCNGLAEPLDLKINMKLLQDDQENEEWAIFQFTNPKYVLLGFEEETVLVMLVLPESFDEWYGGVNVYTSAMLDYI